MFCMTLLAWKALRGFARYEAAQRALKA